VLIRGKYNAATVDPQFLFPKEGDLRGSFQDGGFPARSASSAVIFLLR
jgi:hypothetical protein